MAGKYLTLQNKALRQGMYVRYVALPYSSVPYTTNGHILVRGKTPELKPLKSQDDHRNKEALVLTDSKWLSDIKKAKAVELMFNEAEGEELLTRANDYKYQTIYIEYIMAKYPVANWLQGGDKLVAVDVKENIIAIIAPMSAVVPTEGEEYGKAK